MHQIKFNIYSVEVISLLEYKDSMKIPLFIQGIA